MLPEWNTSITTTVGEWHFGYYREVAVVEGLLKCNWDQGYWSLYQSWLLIRGDRNEGLHRTTIYDLGSE